MMIRFSFDHQRRNSFRHVECTIEVYVYYFCEVFRRSFDHQFVIGDACIVYEYIHFFIELVLIVLGDCFRGLRISDIAVVHYAHLVPML